MVPTNPTGSWTIDNDKLYFPNIANGLVSAISAPDCWYFHFINFSFNFAAPKTNASISKEINRGELSADYDTNGTKFILVPYH